MEKNCLPSRVWGKFLILRVREGCGCGYSKREESEGESFRFLRELAALCSMHLCKSVFVEARRCCIRGVVRLWRRCNIYVYIWSRDHDGSTRSSIRYSGGAYCYSFRACTHRIDCLLESRLTAPPTSIRGRILYHFSMVFMQNFQKSLDKQKFRYEF